MANKDLKPGVKIERNEKRKRDKDEKVEYYKIPGSPELISPKDRLHSTKEYQRTSERPKNSTFTTYSVLLIILGIPELITIVYFGYILDISYYYYVFARQVCFFSILFQPLIIMKVISIVLLFTNKNYKLAGIFLIIQGLILLILNISINIIEFFFIYNTLFLLCFGGFYLLFGSIFTILIGIAVIKKGKNEDEHIKKMNQKVSSMPHFEQT